jgi:hypothetical protein
LAPPGGDGASRALPAAEISELKAIEADLQEFATRKVRELDDEAARRAEPGGR